MSRLMVISEKPMAAKKLAEALDEQGKPVEIKKRKASYYECKRNDDTLVVVYALGHLFELRQIEKGWTYPRLETEWVPKYEVVKKAQDTKYIINLIKKLSKDVDRFIVATDHDMEGSLIGYTTLKYACGADPKTAERMFFSSLTKTDLIEAFENRASSLDFSMINVGCARHQIDWLYGINLTRAMTLAVKDVSGWFRIVSTGRVQGPTLGFVAEREMMINMFVPIPFWRIEAVAEHEGKSFELEYSMKRISKENHAERIVESLEDKSLTVDTIRTTTTLQNPPVPFNLSGLQYEAYRHFKFKPSRTLALAQKLYLDALISYPRTSSQRIPETLDVKTIIEGLRKNRIYAKLSGRILETNLVPVQGKKDDPAHPAIHPTGLKPERKLTPSEGKVYDLIVRRFLALFADSSKRESIRADLVRENHRFYVRGLRVLELGWMEYYGPYATLEERSLPSISKGDTVDIASIVAERRHTSPPSRFNPSSLLRVLEKENLGTKATRSTIVESLRSRGYTLSDRHELSTLGYAAFETLKCHVSKLLSASFTRELELEMNCIHEGTSTRQEVLSRAKDGLLTLLETFKAHDKEIGEALVFGLRKYWKAKQEIGTCPSCGDGTLNIIRSPKTGKRFVGCSNYKEGLCNQTYPLPQKGDISPLDKMCPHCGHHMIRILSRRGVWETCINWSLCLGRQDDIKALEMKRREHRKETSTGSEKLNE
ncbi:MAG: DNA topoisomerase I [Candidatus Thorarchaeota archaeon]|nr:MAG: DNA topoisomerase I [Candidatus Thorarchaeota archaeon]